MPNTTRLANRETQRHDFVLAIASGMTTASAAEMVGISKATGHRWANDAEVIAAVAEARNEVRRRTVDRLVSASLGAANVLSQIALDETATKAVRVRAATAILTETRATIEVEDLARRLHDIEQSLASSPANRTLLQAIEAESAESA